MSCQPDHPYDQIAYSYGRHDRMDPSRSVPPNMRCNECKENMHYGMLPFEFLQLRGLMFEQQTGQDPSAWRDMLGRPIEKGSLVVYPAMSGRSAQIVLGEVLDIDMNRKRDPLSADELIRLKVGSHHGAPYSIKIQPMGSSRWKQHYGRWDPQKRQHDTDIRPVTLWANAPSVINVGYDAE